MPAQTGFQWPQVNNSRAGFADSVYLFADMDASGVDDVLIENPNGQMGYVDVVGGARPGLLQTIATTNGISTSITYQDMPTLARIAAASGNPWTLQSPQSTHVVTQVMVIDQTPGATQPWGIVNYVYGNPVFDGRDREFVGFSTVEKITLGDPSEPTVHTKTTFYQGFCQDNTLMPPTSWPQTYGCPVQADYPNHALRGLPILTETFGDQTAGQGSMSGAALSTVHRTFGERPIYQGMDGRSVHITLVTGTDTYLYNNTVPVVRQTSSPNRLTDVTTTDYVQIQPELPFSLPGQYTHLYVQDTYQDVWGANHQSYDYGQVDGSGNSLDGQIVDVVTATVAPQDTVDYWIWRANSVTRQGNLPGGANIGARTVNYSYDARGNPQTVTSWLSGSEPMARSAVTLAAGGGVPAPPGAPPGVSQDQSNVTLASYTVDSAGMVTQIAQPGATRCKKITYDSSYDALPTAVTTYTDGCGVKGLTSLVLGYAYGLGRVTDTSAADGQETKIQYEPYGRVQSIQRPDPATAGLVESFSGVTIDYGDTLAPRVVHKTVTDHGANTLNYWTLLDGFGQATMTVSQADTSAGDPLPYIVSGQVARNARGDIHVEYPPFFTANWSAAGPPASLASLAPSGLERTKTFDAFGRVTAAFDLGGIEILARQYAAVMYAEQDADQMAGASQGQTVVGFDGHGRMRSVEKTGNGGYLLTQVTYLPTGEPWVIDRTGTDSTGATYPPYERWMQYDSLGRMVLNVEPASSTGFYAIGQNNPAGPLPPPSTLKAWTYAYDDVGDLVATTDARGCGKNIQYDGAGRPLYEDYIGCTANHLPYSAPSVRTGAGAEVWYQYDKQGRLSSVSDRAAFTQYQYDARSRVTQVERNVVQPNVVPIPGTGYAPYTFQQQLAYDDLDRLVAQSTGEDPTIPELNGASVTGLPTPSTSAITLQYSQRGVPSTPSAGATELSFETPASTRTGSRTRRPGETSRPRRRTTATTSGGACSSRRRADPRLACGATRATPTARRR